MNAGVKLAGFALALAAMVGGGAALGSAVGPIGVGDGEGGHGGGHVTERAEADETASPGPAALPAGGLLVSQDGYTLRADDRTFDAGRPNEVAFTIVGPDGAPLQDYELLHDRELHLVVVSRDLARFVHVHPTRDAQGVWSVDLPALPAGGYRAYADFQPVDAEQITLGIDLTVPGRVPVPKPLTESRTTEVDGYEATLDGQPEPGDASEITITVRRDGEVVTTEPYLGAAGHLVAIRDGDLAYLHVHPLDDEPAGPVRFAVDAPSVGTYGLYFDFAVDGTVRTAAFTLLVGDEPAHFSDPDARPATTAVGVGADHGTDAHGH